MYKNISISVEVIRASQTHHTPHAGRPQSEPVASEINVKIAPVVEIAVAIMNEDYSIRLSLLKVSWRDKEADVETNHEQDHGDGREPRNHFPGERVEIRGSCVLIPVDRFLTHQLNFDNLQFILQAALPKNSFTCTAVPSDVRKASGLPGVSILNFRATPSFWAQPKLVMRIDGSAERFRTSGGIAESP
jgi:hypothetical protein